MAESVSRASVFQVASSATSATLLPAQQWRNGLMIFNTDANDLYIKYGTTASITSFTVKIPGGAYWEMPHPPYTGIIDGIWSADGSGSAVITEL
jgi:hypothetical protein